MELKKELGLLDVFCIASGAMFSSGLFILPGLAFSIAGPAVSIAYILAGLLALTGMLSQAELVSAMPKAGGAYFFITRSMGPAVGTINGLMIWFSLALKSALALVGMAAFAELVVGIDSIQTVAVPLCAVFVVVNLLGVKGASKIQVFLVLGLLIILFGFITRGVSSVAVSNFEPFAPNGIGPIFSAAGFVFISYGGLLKVASVAEEVKNPGKTVPLGMILSLLVASTFYFLVTFVTTGVLDGAALSATRTPISDAANAFMGRPGLIILSIAAMLAFISTANAGIMAAARYPLALSRDGLLPRFLGRIAPRFGTPYVSIIITGILMIVALFLELGILVKVASAVLILTYLFSCLSVIILREGRIQNYRPQFRSPLYPYVQIIGVVGCLLLLFEMGLKIMLVSSVFVVVGFILYWFYGRIRSEREYALLHLVERITAEELTDGKLESELREIIRERDDIIKDRFDREIEESFVLDIEGSISSDEFFKVVAEKMSEHLKMPADDIFHLLIDREKSSSTVISPFVAIPHIIIDGENKFEILIARSKEGIVFSENAPNVNAVFILMGTKDERNFHLRALAAIAQVIDDRPFEKRWMKAKNQEALRDIVLLGDRVRAKN